MATETQTPTRKPTRKVVEEVPPADTSEQTPVVVEPEPEEPKEEEEDPLEILEPKSEPRVWIIGKPPEKGGDDDEWSRYVQYPLGYMARMRFFALLSNTIAQAMRAGGGLSLGGADIFTGDGSIRQRAEQLTDADFSDAGSFMALAMQLVGYAPDFLVECYAIWLDVPMQERSWFRRVLNQPYDPEHNKWGITDEVGLEMIEIFIDQNYSDIREFFSGKVPALVRRVQAHEQEAKKKSSAGRKSALAQ